ncbi:MAG: lysylphosphatidylglycerol synthase transmembrane domain-containing protein [Bacteriovoracaceae bacterium]
MKKYFGLLKFVFAFGIIIYLINKGELDFSLIGEMTYNHKSTLALGLVGLLLAATISAVRWRSILHIKSAKKIKVLTMMRLTWIGLFFNCFLPGAVTGDLIKLIYAKEVDPTLKKSFLLMSAFVDRVMGLIGMILLLGISTLVFYDEMIAMGPELEKVIFINALLFLGIIIFLTTLFFPQNIQKIILTLIEKLPIIGKHLVHPITDVWTIGKNRKVVFMGITLSMIMQACNVMALYTLASPFFNTSLELAKSFSFIPIGFVAMAIPIAPAGMGVGHAIFGTLFSYYGIKGGASLFNIYFVAMASINLIGAIPYLISGKKLKLDDDNSLEELVSR